jgi:hypothetical protein
MADSRRASTDTSTPSRLHPLWARELVQPRADDVVLAAALFKPNAVGAHELTSVTGLGHRQLLKARGAYLGERIVLGVTALHVHAIALFLGNRIGRSVGCWPRAELCAAPVSALGDTVEPVWPALLLTDHCRRSLAELQVLRRGDDAWRVLAMLLRCDDAFTR